MAEKPEVTPDMEEKQDKHTDPDTLRQKLAEAKSKAAEYFDQLLRLRAEFENFRKRAEREKRESLAWGKQEVLLQLVGLVDVFEQALTQAHTAKDLKHVVKGVEMLHTSFAQFLRAEGLEPIEMLGKPLDPSLAEVIAQQEVEEDQVGQVLEEFQKGYLFQGKILRPSRVSVGVSKKEAASKESKKSKEHKESETPEAPQASEEQNSDIKDK